jgi:hypothetical protein
MADDKIQRAIQAAHEAMLREDRYADGGEAPEDKGFFSKIFSGKQYQSTGEELVDPQTGAIRWGSGESPADYVRASDEVVRRQRAEEAARKQADAQRIEVAQLAPPKPTSIADFSRLDFQYPEGQRPADLEEPASAPLAAARASDMSPYAYLPLISSSESQNIPTVKNPYSPAGGLYQFMPPTWNSVLRRMDPERFGRMSDEQIAPLRMRADTANLQHQAARFHLDNDIIPTLKKAEIPINPATVYLSWFQGPGGAVKAWNAPGNATIKELFPNTIAQNANMRYHGKPYAEWTRNDLINWVTETMAAKARSSRRADGGRTGYANEGAVAEEPIFDPMGNVAVPGTPSEGSEPGAYEAAMDKIGKMGAAVGSPIKRALEATAETYGHSSREAAQETEALRQQAFRNLAGESGVVGRALALPQMGLSAMSNVMEPATALAKTIGKGATYMTGNPQFGERVEFLAGFADPSHVGALKAATPMAAMAAPPVKAAVQTAREVTAAPRELSPLGLYSYGSETAMGLPQAKGTPEQIAAMLQKQGVKPEEMFASGFANEAATNAKRAQIEAEFSPKIAEAQRALEGLTPGTPEFKAAERQLKNLSSTMRGEMDRALVLSEDWASRPAITREEAAQLFRERMPQVEETILGVEAKPPISESRYRELASEWERRQLTPEEKAEFSAYERYVNGERPAGSEPFKPTKFEKYTLPGGENYREVLLKLPDNRPQVFTVRADSLTKEFKTLEEAEAYRNALHERWPDSFRPAYIVQNKTLDPRQSGFRSPHWKDENVLAHLRMSDRTGPNGERILHVEEIQSDWGQKGKKEGFSSTAPVNNFKIGDMQGFEAERVQNPMFNKWELSAGNQSLGSIDVVKKGKKTEYVPNIILRQNESHKLGPFKTYEEALDAVKNLEVFGYKQTHSLNAIPIPQADKFIALYLNKDEALKGATKHGIPSAPYVTSTQGWTDLALKRALKEAAEGGYDRLVWTPGVEQAKRYDLSKQISRLVLEDNPQGGQTLRAYSNSGDQVISKPITDPQKELPELIGKDVTEKLMAQDPLNPKRFNENLPSNEVTVVPKENRYQISAPWGWSTHVGKGVVGSAEEAAEYGARYFNKLAKEANSKLEYQGPVRSLEGQQLSIGGEGMKGYYDKIVPAQLQKLLKKLDPEAKIGRDTIGSGKYEVVLPNGKVIAEYPEKVSADIIAKKEPGASVRQNAIEVPMIQITPAMRENILKGMPHMADGGSVYPQKLSSGSIVNKALMITSKKPNR